MEAYVELEGSGFSPEEFADVKQCLETLLAVRAGSQPLDRNFGIDYEGIVGYPTEIAKNMLSLEIIEKVNIYEPRVEVESVDFEGSTDGQLRPRVHFVRREE